MKSDDRVCDLRTGCLCESREDKQTCVHYHLPMPNVRSAYSQHGMVRDLREQGMEQQMKNVGSTEHKHKIKRAQGNFGKK